MQLSFGLYQERLLDRVVGAYMEVKCLEILTGCGGARQIKSMLTNSDGLLHDRKVVPHTPSFCDEPD
jgi:hypothetical protein